ncbi:MAG: FAD-binding and (Fe-S)-binding domain-containing protein [Gemmatimonadales bacterium]
MILPVVAPERAGRGALSQSIDLDVAALESELRSSIDGEVRFGAGDRALYATDASNYRRTPIGVVIPRHAGDVEAAVAAARRHGAPVLSRGGGTSLAGQCCNTAVVLDFSKYMRGVLEVDAQRRLARVLPGTYLDDLRAATDRHGLTFGPDPATHSHCTIGGMIGNDSCGVHSVMAELWGKGPRTGDSLAAMEVLTYDGARMVVGETTPEARRRIAQEGGRRAEIYADLERLVDRWGDAIRTRFPKLLRRVSGYDLPQLLPENGFHVARALAGSESTCVTILQATLELIPSPRHRALLLLGFPSVVDAGAAVPDLRACGPIGLEGMDDVLVRAMQKKGMHHEGIESLPEGRAWLLVELGGENAEEAVARARGALDAMRSRHPAPSALLLEDPQAQRRMFELRESGLGATAFVAGERDTWEGWEDSAVPVEKLGEYLGDLRALLDRYGYHGALYGHFGQGCVHTRIDFDLRSREGIDRFRAFTREAAELVCVRYGGSLSGEHGDGQARGDLLPIMYDSDLLDAMREFKRIWDPEQRMNPGKVVDARPRTDDLRIARGGASDPPSTRFSYPEDDGSLTHATLRCVGVGMCRRREGGTMCPSYRVTWEEKHTTRGRAHLLFEMLRGETITDGWRSEEVKEALDLCLSCKGCKGDCPVQVDIATLKAEFLHHYYEGRRRPRHAYAFGLIDVWARLAELAPGVVNLATQAPGLRRIAGAAVGMAPERTAPAFARRTFRSWYRRRRSRAANSRAARGAPRGPVLLWVDTFNDHFFPDVLAAGLEVLEGAGFGVRIAEERLCCGRPLYDHGMLDLAERRLDRILAVLSPDIERGTPVVGLEPSCVSVLRDELPNLKPHDTRATRLSRQTVTLGELLLEREVPLPDVRARAFVHGHCHEKAVLGGDHGTTLLERMGVEVRRPESGCCGMAGAFGFERDKYDVSTRIAEQRLAPALRNAAPEDLVVADGFSCREQIRHTTGRTAVHTAEVLRAAAGPEDGRRPVTNAAVRRRRDRGLRPASTFGPALILGAAAAGSLGLLATRRLARTKASR